MNKLKLTDCLGGTVIVFTDHLAMIKSARGAHPNAHSEVFTDADTGGRVFVQETFEQIEAKLNGDE